MKTPDEIKKGLWNCLPRDMELCDMCEYNDWGEPEEFPCWAMRIKETIAYIQQLERERDALLRDLTAVCESVNTCLACDHYRTDWPKPGCELIGLT